MTTNSFLSTPMLSIRSVIAVLLLINYLLVVGAGCVSRPGDSRELVMVQTTEEGHNYQECRYLRMDGLETFLADALASRYERTSDAVPHHVFTVVIGVDAHHLPCVECPYVAVAYRQVSLPVARGALLASGVVRDMYTPPWLG